MGSDPMVITSVMGSDPMVIRRDITYGYVDGVSYSGNGENRAWYDVAAPVGFFENLWKLASPNHE